MKILFIGHEKNFNGASYSMLNLIKALSGNCQFIVVLPYKNGPVAETLKRENIKFYYIPFHRWVEPKNSKFQIKKLFWKLCWNKQNDILANKFVQIVKNEKIDIIHTNTSVVDFGYRLSKLSNIPHIWHIREFGEEDFGIYPLCTYKKYFQKIADNNYLVCVSKAVMKKFQGKVSPDRITLIYNGVERKNINHNKIYKTNGKLICLQTGVLIPAKGQAITIKAIQQLHKQGYSDIELLLAGSGRLSDLHIDISNIDGVTSLGQVNNLPEIRKNVDIEIVASKAEAFGRVTVEAMMGGIPVIGSDSGGTSELIQNGKNGLFFESGNAEDLASKILYFYLNRNEIERMGKNAYMDSKDYFSIERCAKELLEFYKGIDKKREKL